MNRMKYTSKRFWIYSFLILILNPVLLLNIRAQEISKEVFVMKPYEPVLSDASKISLLPSVENIETTIPSFNYRITPSPVETPFEVRPIKPAKMVSSGLPKIYKSMLKIGIGNYVTPLAEFNISNLHSKEYSIGAYFYHKSSHSNIVLENEDKVPGGYAINKLNLYGKKFYNNLGLSGNITLDHDGFNYYGYNTHLFRNDSLPAMDRSDIHQRILSLGAQTEVHSTYSDSTRLNYKLNLHYNYLTDKSDDNENALVIKTSFGKLVGSFMGGIDLNLSYYKPSGNIDSSGNTLFQFSPSISKRSEDWKFLIGFDTYSDKEDVSRFHFYPRGLLEFTVIEKIMIPFIGIGGKLEANHYGKIVQENHFITPGLKVKNTSQNMTAFGGIKGSISPQVRFRADFSFSTFEDMYFFINDTTTELQNTYTVDYDDVDLIKYHGELAIEPSVLWNVTADFNYYSYSMLNLKKPWHKPQYDLTISAAYNLKEKFLIDGDLILYGQRYAKTTLTPEGFYKLDPVLDINLGIEYLFSKLFTVFFDIYNLTGRSYLLWNQYPSQRFNFLLGFTYKL
jgi:hypothetical protein